MQSTKETGNMYSMKDIKNLQAQHFLQVSIYNSCNVNIFVWDHIYLKNIFVWYLINLFLYICEQSFNSCEFASKHVATHLQVQIWNQQPAGLRLKKKDNYN